MGLLRTSVPVLLGCVFLMGLHSTLFGPVKYAYLPQHLSERELTGGNGMVEMGTFVAILLGNVAGGLLIAMPEVGAQLGGLGLCGGGGAGPGAGAFRAGVAGHRPGPAIINWNPFTETWRNLKLAHGNVVVFRSLLGISWMWFFGAVFLAQFPSLRQGRAARQRAGGLAAAGGVLGGHRHRLAAVRDAEPATWRSAWCRWARSA
jgi:MFS family permease